MAKCATCGADPIIVKYEVIPAGEPPQRLLPVVVLFCGGCNTALSVQFDPIWQNTQNGVPLKD